MTPVWVRRRVWKCFISSGEFCTKWCQLTMRPLGYQSNVSNKDYCASFFRRSWGYWNGLGWLWYVSRVWSLNSSAAALHLLMPPDLRYPTWVFFLKKKRLWAAAVIPSGQFTALGKPAGDRSEGKLEACTRFFSSAFYLCAKMIHKIILIRWTSTDMFYWYHVALGS